MLAVGTYAFCQMSKGDAMTRLKDSLEPPHSGPVMGPVNAGKLAITRHYGYRRLTANAFGVRLWSDNRNFIVRNNGP